MRNFNWCGYDWMPHMTYGVIHTGQPWMWFDAYQVLLLEDELALYVEKKSKVITIEGETFNPQLACGTIESVETFGYGKFSAEIQLPKGRNLWPAFWLVGEGKWPKGGEIDIMEAWSDKSGSYFRATIPQPPYLVPSWDTTTNVHWEDGEHKSTGSRRLPLVCSLKNPTKNFVKYEVEWRPNTISFFANGHRVRAYGWEVAEHLLNKKMRVIFDLWTTQANFTCDTPMIVRNFEYKPLDIL